MTNLDRYYVLRATTRVMLDRDADLTPMDDQTVNLSAVGSASFICPPSADTVKAADGRLVYGDWDTIVVVESGRAITFAGIVTSSGWDDGAWTITCDTLSTLAHDTPFLDTYYAAETDPADVMRAIWAHVKSFPDSAAQGVNVVGSTPLRIGTYSTQNKTDTATAYANATKAYDTANAKLKTLRADRTAAGTVYSQRVAAVTAASKALTAKTGTQAQYNAAVAARDAQRTVVNQKAAAVDAQETVVANLSAAKKKAYDTKVAASKAEKDDGGAYALEWWQAPDCGQSIDSLASDNGFDWTERWAWTDSTKTDITTSIVVGYPRAGRQRDDLTFEQGVNITNVVKASSGEGFANEQLGIGAGEGSGSLRRSRSTRDGRARRVAVVNAKDIKSAAAMDKRLQKEQAAHKNTLTFASIEVAGTAAVPLGVWSLGDDILVVADVENLGTVRIWHRITGWTKTGDNTATIALRRSDSYIYGG